MSLKGVGYVVFDDEDLAMWRELAVIASLEDSPGDPDGGDRAYQKAEGVEVHGASGLSAGKNI